MTSNMSSFQLEIWQTGSLDMIFVSLESFGHGPFGSISWVLIQFKKGLDVYYKLIMLFQWLFSNGTWMCQIIPLYL